MGGEPRDAEEHRDRDRAHDREGGCRVLRLGALERGDAVGDRLHAGERGGTLREGLQDREQADRCRRRRGARDQLRADADRRTSTDAASEPEHDEEQDRGDEPVGRDREDRPRLARTAEVRERHQQDEQHGEQHAMFVRPAERRPDREHAGNDRDDDGHHVVE